LAGKRIRVHLMPICRSNRMQEYFRALALEALRDRWPCLTTSLRDGALFKKCGATLSQLRDPPPPATVGATTAGAGPRLADAVKLASDPVRRGKRLRWAGLCLDWRRTSFREVSPIFGDGLIGQAAVVVG
jgi:hypothetical protein